MRTHLVRQTIVWIVLFALVLVMATAANPLGASAASDLNAPLHPTIPVANFLNADGTLNLKGGVSGSLDVRGWNVTLDPKRGPILSKSTGKGNDTPSAIPPQKPSAVPGNWTPFPFQGVNTASEVRSIIQAPNPSSIGGNGIYVGGTFAGSGDTPPTFGNLGGIARYYNGVWWPLPHGGLGNGQGVYAMAVVGSYIYVGGDFTQNGDGTNVNNLHNIARYDTTTDTWQPLPDAGLNSTVWALTVANGHLYVGGAFTASTTGATTGLNGVARYDGGATWTALSKQGLNGTVYALAASGNNVYIGGSFSDTVNPATGNLNNIALYSDSGATWSALADHGLSGSVYALAFSGSNLYVGGGFTTSLSPSIPLNYLAMYNGSWNAINSSGAIGLDALVRTITVIGTDVFVGGNFQNPNGVSTNQLNRIALLNGSAWTSLPNTGMNNTVFTIAAVGLPTLYNLYVGGSFDNVASGSVAGLGRAASLANTCSAIAGTNNWSAGGTWGCGGAPSGTDAVTVPSNATVTIDVDGVSIDGPLTVDGTIDATNHILTLGASAVVGGAGQIIGTIVRNTPGNATRTYSNANTQITLSGSSLNALTVTLTLAKPAGLTYAVDRYYTITPGTGTFTSANLQLPYKTTELSHLLNPGSETNLGLWRNNGSNWVYKGGTVDASNHWVTLAGVTQFSPWAISDSGAPSAVTLSTFSANTDGSSNVVLVAGALLATVVMASVWQVRKRRS